MVSKMDHDLVILNQLAASRLGNEKPPVELLRKLGETHSTPSRVAEVFCLLIFY